MLNSKTHTREQVNVKYTSSKGEVTERVIMPTSIPDTNVRALDLTDLDSETRDRLQQLYSEYSEYLRAHMANAHRFEDYVELAHPDKSLNNTLKWRTFGADKLEILDPSEDPSS